MLKNGSLPRQLELLLMNPRIKKVGVQINADLVSLRKASDAAKPFPGGIELAKFAHERCVLDSQLTSSPVGLADMCALVPPYNLQMAHER